LLVQTCQQLHERVYKERQFTNQNNQQIILLFEMAQFVTIIIACLAFSMTYAHFGSGQEHGRMKFGPIGKIYGNLTTEQQQEIQSILQNSFNETKGTVKAQIQSFVSNLSTELQNEVAAIEQKFTATKANISQEAQSLPSDAQALVNSVLSVINDESITMSQEHQQIHQLIQAANQTTLNEIEQSGIRIPGFMKHGGGRGRPSSSQENEGSIRGGGFGQYGNGQFGGRGQNQDQFGGNSQGQFGNRQGGNNQGFGGNNQGQFGQNQFGQNQGQFGQGQYGQGHGRF